MNTLPQAFKTRRVKETLVALSQHVETALNLARLDPVQTSEPELSGDILQPLPDVDTIVPDYYERPTTTTDTDTEITMTGTYLSAVLEVYLIRIGEVGPWVAPGSVTDVTDPPSDDTLKANFSLTKAPHGHYNLLLIDSYGQTALVRNAFTIRPCTHRPLGQPASTTALRARSKAKAKKD
jgi:hypothetical protein